MDTLEILSETIDKQVNIKVSREVRDLRHKLYNILRVLGVSYNQESSNDLNDILRPFWDDYQEGLKEHYTKELTLKILEIDNG